MRAPLVLLALFLAGASAHAANKPAPAAPAAAAAAEDATLKPEVLSAKAFLEDLLVRRYSQALAVEVDRQAFSMSAQIDLVQAEAKPAADDSDTPPDMVLGTLDPDELLKNYAGSDAYSQYEGYLKNYRFKNVGVSVGLKEELGPDAKAQVEKWVGARLKADFGAAGKGDVSFIKEPAEKKKAPPANFAEWLSQNQALAGQLALALAILLGTLLYKLLASKDASKALESSTNVTLQQQQAHEAEEKAKTAQVEREAAERAESNKEFRMLAKRIVSLSPTLSKDCERVIRTWCQGGDDGKLKLACFAEAVGKTMGRLPIPADALADLGKVFAKMPEMSPKDRLELLKKVYWDVLMAVNLGADSLEQPFGYLGGMNVGMVNNVLMDQNPKLKTLVALYMPPTLRESYFQSLDKDAKRALLESAAQMSEIPAEEFKSFDGTIRNKLKPEGAAGVIPLTLGMNKLISSLTPMEEATILDGMSGAAFEEFRRTTASIAFLPQWPDDKITMLLGRAMPDEVAAYLRVRPELKDKFISLSPPMTAEVAADELGRPDNTTDKDKNASLRSLAIRVKEMVDLREVNLEELFPAPKADASAPNNVTPIRPEGGKDDGHKAA